MSENNTSLNVSVDDFNDVTDITQLSPTSESDNDGTTRTDSSDSSYAVVAVSPNCIFSAASDFAGFFARGLLVYLSSYFNIKKVWTFE